MDNLRKRTERDDPGRAQIRGDEIRRRHAGGRRQSARALEAVPAERQEASDEALKALVEGVEVTGREMERLLEKNGITRIARARRALRPAPPSGDVRGARSRACRPAPSCRWCRRATRSATACFAPRWSVSPRAARRPTPPPTAESEADADRLSAPCRRARSRQVDAAAALAWLIALRRPCASRSREVRTWPTTGRSTGTS